MSFSIGITGHSSNPHNQAVQDAVDAALETLEGVEGLTATVTGYSNDGEGSVTLTGSLPRPVSTEATDAGDQ
jgi:hypothetical protein